MGQFSGRRLRAVGDVLVRRVAAGVATSSALTWGTATAGPAAAHGSGLEWAAPVTVDHQPAYDTPIRLNDISCPAAELCVGADAQGRVVTRPIRHVAWWPGP